MAGPFSQVLNNHWLGRNRASGPSGAGFPSSACTSYGTWGTWNSAIWPFLQARPEMTVFGTQLWLALS